MESVVEILTRLRADLEGQIAVLQSHRFRVLAIGQDGTTETDCTSVQLALFRSALAELQSAIELAGTPAAGHWRSLCEADSDTV